VGGGETVCTMQLISSLETVRRTKEMHCLIMPVESRLWFGADGCGIEGGVLGGGRRGGSHGGCRRCPSSGHPGFTPPPPFMLPLLGIKGEVDIMRCTALPLCSTFTVLPRSVT